MPNKTAPASVLREGDRPRLEALVRSATVRAGVAQRARIVLLAAEGVANYEIAERVGVSRPTVNLWRHRYAEQGMAGLDGIRPPGRPRSVDRAKVVAATLTPPPKSLGVTHWSSRLLRDRLGIEHSTVAAIWKEYGVKPWKTPSGRGRAEPGAVAVCSLAAPSGRRSNHSSPLGVPPAVPVHRAATSCWPEQHSCTGLVAVN